jgi:hypothetical protein
MRGFSFAGMMLAAFLLATPAPAQNGFALTDARTDKAEKTKLLSYLIGSCDYGVFRVGDPGRRPNRIERLRADLETGLGPLLVGKAIEVTDYRLYLNTARSMRGSVGGHYGLVGEAVSEGYNQSCAGEKDREGWFPSSEVTTPYSPLIVYITVRVDGVAYEARHVHSPPLEIRPSARTKFVVSKAQWNQTDEIGAPQVDAALAAANQLLIAEIRKGMATEPKAPSGPMEAPAPG